MKKLYHQFAAFDKLLPIVHLNYRIILIVYYRIILSQLCSFDMLETNVFPHSAPEFEKKFDDIVYTPDFFQNFEPPKLSNPFQNGLREALIAWLHRFKPIELEWRQLIKKRRAESAKQQDERVERYLQNLTI